MMYAIVMKRGEPAEHFLPHGGLILRQLEIAIEHSASASQLKELPL